MTLPPSPDKLDQLLAKHFDSTLEPQRGRALAAFRRQTAAPQSAANPPAAPAPTPAGPARPIRMISRRTIWISAGISSLLAACLALVVTMQSVTPSAPATRVIGVDPADRAAPPANMTASLGGTDEHRLTFDPPGLDEIELSRDVDGGVALLNDNTPVRVIHHQTVRQTQWVDPVDNATYSVTQPIEKVGYEQIQPY
jgi:hypothetical protein